MISHLNIDAGWRNNKTYLKNCYYTRPFKIANITEDKTQCFLKLMIMSSSPGILNNDHYHIEINVEAEALLNITTQGFQRLFSMKDSAKQTTSILLGNNASLTYLPHPVVPHKTSNYTSINTIHLATSHNLFWSEIITCGRKLCDEEFMFTRLQNITGIYIDGKLVVKENILLEPHKKDITAIGQLENYTHQSSVLFMNDTADCEYLKYECRELLSATEGIEFGISALPAKGFAIRMLGYKGELLFDIHKKLQTTIEKSKTVTINTSRHQYEQ
jgi:urease accessory protein